jgi:uncharacterized protein (DUF1330 family)
VSSYLVGVVKKHDMGKYSEYAAAGFRLIDGVKVEVAAAENPEVVEGEFPGTSIIIMKFADDDAARKWYFSDGYQEIISLRHAAADTAFNIIFKA